MVGWVVEFFSSGGFMPHGHCFQWTPSILWTWVLSDLLIAASYLAIPVALVRIMRLRGDIPFNGLVLLFAGFILACGASHAFSVVTLWHPFYGAEGLFKAGTAAVSMGTAVALWRLSPALVALPSPQDLRQANAELRRREAELQAANARLEQFAHMASHDLRAPLKSLVSLAEMAMQTSDGPSDALKHIHRVSRELESMVAGYRRLSELVLEPERLQTISVSELLESARSLRGDLPPTRLHGDASLRCDPTLMTQVLVNALDNAQRYGAGGEVVIACSATQDSVSMAITNPVVEEVAVNEALFAPFRRMTTQRDGQGLGLAICRRIVQIHHGEVGASSESGRFTLQIRLPSDPLTSTVDEP